MVVASIHQAIELLFADACAQLEIHHQTPLHRLDLWADYQVAYIDWLESSDARLI